MSVCGRDSESYEGWFKEPHLQIFLLMWLCVCWRLRPRRTNVLAIIKRAALQGWCPNSLPACPLLQSELSLYPGVRPFARYRIIPELKDASISGPHPRLGCYCAACALFRLHLVARQHSWWPKLAAHLRRRTSFSRYLSHTRSIYCIGGTFSIPYQYLYLPEPRSGASFCGWRQGRPFAHCDVTNKDLTFSSYRHLRRVFPFTFASVLKLT
jgi:hypothetical protein